MLCTNVVITGSNLKTNAVLLAKLNSWLMVGASNCVEGRFIKCQKYLSHRSSDHNFVGCKKERESISKVCLK